MKPMLILPPDTMSADDIKELRGNDICVVVAKDPSKVKFLDPIPAVGQRTQIEDAAIKLSRIILSGQWASWSSDNTIGRNTASKIYVDCLISGTPLDPRGTQDDKENNAFNSAKIEESARLGREEAKAERLAMKAKQAKDTTAKPK